MVKIPATDEKWFQEFVDELEFRKVRPRDVEQARATALAHVLDSGESAAEAFGAPRLYAASLDLPGKSFLAPDRTPALPAALSGVCASRFSFSAYQWARDGWDSGNANFTIIMGMLMIVACAWLTYWFANRTLQEAIRTEFTGEELRLWGMRPALAVSLPWVIPVVAFIPSVVMLLR